MSIASLVMDLFSSCWTDPAIGQGGPHHRQALSVDLHAAGLEVQVQGLVKVRTLRKAVLLFHEVTHGEIPVSRGPLGQKHRVVEAKKLVASEFVKTLVDELILLSWTRPGLNVVEDEGAGHDGASIQHGVVGLV